MSELIEYIKSELGSMNGVPTTQKKAVATVDAITNDDIMADEVLTAEVEIEAEVETVEPEPETPMEEE